MSLNLAETAEAARPPRPASRPNGQWKIDGTAPLNGNEECKQQDNGLNVRERIEQIYSKQGFDSIDGTDLHGRFRWWGLYTQRKPGIDGGKTATLEPHELEDEYFMLRVRIDGGPLTTEQLRVIGEHLQRVRPRHRRHHRPAEHPAALDPGRGRAGDLAPPRGRRARHHRGLRRRAARRSSAPRSPASPRDEIIDPTPAIGEITATLHRRPGARQPAAQVQDRDHRPPEPGRRARDQRHRASSASCTPSSAPATTCGSAAACRPARASPSASAPSSPPSGPPRCGSAWSQIFRDYGYRRLRNKARLKFLLADWGAGEVPRGARERVPGYGAARRPAGARPPTRRATTSACTSRTTAATTSASTPSSAASPAPSCRRSPTWSRRTARTGCAPPRTRSSCVLDVADEHVEPLVDGARRAGPGTARPSLFRRSHDRLHRHRVLQARDRRDQGTPPPTPSPSWRSAWPAFDGSPQPITLHVNGCPNSCARIQTADIGLKGQLLPDGDGGRCPASRCTSAAGSPRDRDDAGLGRTVRGLKVTADELADYVERVVRSYLADRERPASPSPAGRSVPTRRRSDEHRESRTGHRTRHRRDPSRAPARTSCAASPSGQPPSSAMPRPSSVDRLGRRELRHRRVAVACSMADAVLPHLVAAQLPGVDVLFLDTGYHFAETFATRDEVARALDVHDRRRAAGADRRRAGRRARQGPVRPRPGACCRLRKVDPLNRRSRGYELWFTGVRRDEAPTRTNTPLVEWDERNGLVKVNPSRPGASTSCWLRRSARRAAEPAAARTATRRSAARRAPSRSPPARTRAPAAGPGSPRPNAASTHDREHQRSPRVTRRSQRPTLTLDPARATGATPARPARPAREPRRSTSSARWSPSSSAP